MLAEPAEARLTWIPRDLWCETLRSRINLAYRRGGHTLLVAALREHGLHADHSLVLSRDATEAALARAVVVVPVPVRMVFSYPLTPTTRIEDGAKEVVFTPPAEVLRGERIHQWIGARFTASDLHRIERQKILVRRLIERGFDFRQALTEPRWYRASDAAAIDELSRVGRDWTFATFDAVTPATIDGLMVLVSTRGAAPDTSVRHRPPPGFEAAAPRWGDRPQWVPVDAPVRSTARARSREALLAVVAQFRVETSPRYQAEAREDRRETWCNIFTWDVTRALDAEVPHWVDDAGKPAPEGQGRELTANATVHWLETHGATRGWTEGDAAGAAAAAEAGQPVLAVWRNTDGHGHLALVVPAVSGAPGIHIAQAGAACFTSQPMARGFGERPVRFFIHP